LRGKKNQGGVLRGKRGDSNGKSRVNNDLDVSWQFEYVAFEIFC
jgi:hypothetical protein